MISGDAVFSDDSLYRYSLTRTWGTGGRYCMFVGLNPSIADAVTDDPTIRRCAEFARRLAYDGFIMTNLFALRATDPKRMMRHPAPIGPDNDAWIKKLLPRTWMVIACWGAWGRHLGRADAVYELLLDHGAVPVCLGQTVEGEPAHPLYMRGDSPINAYIRRPHGRRS